MTLFNLIQCPECLSEGEAVDTRVEEYDDETEVITLYKCTNPDCENTFEDGEEHGAHPHRL